MKARKCDYAQKPYSCHAFVHESSKVWEREKREGETGKTEARKLMEGKAAQQNKNTSEHGLLKNTAVYETFWILAKIPMLV